MMAASEELLREERARFRREYRIATVKELLETRKEEMSVDVYEALKRALEQI